MTLLLAGQTVSSLAEEKGNKVIEILAAAVPLESVFLGKLLGFLGVAVLFIAFWMALAFGGGLIAATQMDPAAIAAAGKAGKAATALAATPATGWPFFLGIGRSEEHTSELQSLMRISYAVFCLKKKKQTENTK